MRGSTHFYETGKRLSICLADGGVSLFSDMTTRAPTVMRVRTWPCWVPRHGGRVSVAGAGEFVNYTPRWCSLLAG